MKNSVHLERLNSGLFVKYDEEKGILPLTSEEQTFLEKQWLERMLEQTGQLTLRQNFLNSEYVDSFDLSGNLMGTISMFCYSGLALYSMRENERLSVTRFDNGSVYIESWQMNDLDPNVSAGTQAFDINLEQAFERLHINRLENRSRRRIV